MSAADDSLDNKIRAYLEASYPNPVTARTLAKMLPSNIIDSVSRSFRQKLSSRLQSLKRRGDVVSVSSHHGGTFLGWRIWRPGS